MRLLTRLSGLMVHVAIRLLGGVVLLATITFFFVQALPGDPVARILGGNAAPEDAALLRETLGLDQPLHLRYFEYLQSVLLFDFGNSFTGASVWSVLGSRVGHTSMLAVSTIVVVALGAVVLGLIFGALGRDGRRPVASAGFTGATGFVAAIPPYVLAMALVAAFAVSLRWFPVAGASGPASYVLPVIALSLPAIAVLSRIVRVETLGALASDHVRTARSKGVSTLRLYLRHVLPSTLTGALTIGGVVFGYLLGGVAVIENVFQWPGLGTAIVNAVTSRDYPVLQAAVILIGVGVLLVNALVDILIAVIDPRGLEQR